MRRIQLYIPEELDERLRAEAAKTGRSKAALIRESVMSHLGKMESVEQDPITRLVGSIDVEPADIDHIVYDS